MADMRQVEALSRKLARRLFYAMVMYGPSLEKKQILLGRFVDIGCDLFVTAATLAYASAKATDAANSSADVDHMVRLAHYLAKTSQAKIRTLFHETLHNADVDAQAIAWDI